MWIKPTDECIFIDQRKEVKPNIQARWQHLPFKDESFEMVVFDPPFHVTRWQPPDEKARGNDFYGFLLPDTFHRDFYDAFKEFFRVLKTGGFLILKWNDARYSLNKILSLAPKKPLFGQRSWSNKSGQHSSWVTFQK